jgi:uncharacterized protein (TIGR02145 family)
MKGFIILLILIFAAQQMTFSQTGDTIKNRKIPVYQDSPPDYGRGKKGLLEYWDDPLDEHSTSLGIKINRMTTSERNNIVSPAEGLLIFDVTTGCFEAFVYGKWSSISCPPNNEDNLNLISSFAKYYPFKCGGILTDSSDNQTYKTIQIGKQCWMKENLNIGTMIKSNTEQSNNGIIEKYCINDDIQYCREYGGLYQWNELMNYDTIEGRQGICPKGWHIPGLKELVTLTDYLGGDNVAGGKMKEAGTFYWKSPNSGATNESGFSGLPGSYFDYKKGEFNNNRYYGDWWSSSKCSDTNSWSLSLNYNDVKAGKKSAERKFGFSVRCIQD